jgi:hypothetical protein
LDLLELWKACRDALRLYDSALDCYPRVPLLWAKAKPRERTAYDRDLLLDSFYLVACSVFLGAYGVRGRVARGRVLTPSPLLTAPTQVRERGSIAGVLRRWFIVVLDV